MESKVTINALCIYPKPTKHYRCVTNKENLIIRVLCCLRALHTLRSVWKPFSQSFIAQFYFFFLTERVHWCKYISLYSGKLNIYA